MRAKKLACLVILLFLLFNAVSLKAEILNGKILEINKKFNFVIINLGKEDGVKKGMVFMVYRDKTLLGKVETEDIFPRMSSCVILPKWQREEFKINDGVIEE